MMTWSRFRQFCLYGLVASAIVALGFWLAKTKQTGHSQIYYRDFVLPALAQSRDAMASRSATMPDISPILKQHIENQSKIAESNWSISLSVISAQVFGLGLMIYQSRVEAAKRRKEKRLAEETKNEKHGA